MASKELNALRAQLERSPFSSDLGEARAAYEQMGLAFPVGDGVEVTRTTIAGRPVEFAAPLESPASNRIVLYLHGGGYSLGSCNTHRHVAAEICRQINTRVYLPEYRLAPEHPLPAALDDAIAAYRHLLELAPAGGIALAGDSAGAGLVVATLVALRDAALPLPAAAYCMSPWADLRCNSETMTLKADEDPLASPELLHLMATRYLERTDPADPRASPVLADLSGLPPFLIQVGSAEVLLDDAIALARALGLAGVDTRLEIWPEMVHVWQCFYPALPEGRAALERGCEFIGAHLGKH